METLNKEEERTDVTYETYIKLIYKINSLY